MSKTKILIFFLIGLFTLTQCTSKKNVKQSVNKAIKKEEVKKEQLKEFIHHLLVSSEEIP